MAKSKRTEPPTVVILDKTFQSNLLRYNLRALTIRGCIYNTSATICDMGIDAQKKVKVEMVTKWQRSFGEYRYIGYTLTLTDESTHAPVTVNDFTFLQLVIGSVVGGRRDLSNSHRWAAWAISPIQVFDALMDDKYDYGSRSMSFKDWKYEINFDESNVKTD